MRLIKIALLLGSIKLISITAVHADINVVASIKPVHSLVTAIMRNISTPILIVEGAGSPHTYALKPLQAKQIQDADVIFWVGDELETFLEKPIEALAKSAKTIKLIESHGLKKLKFREGGGFDDHDHGEHSKDGHDDHKDHSKDGHDDHKDHSKDGHDDHKDHAKDDHDEHGHDGVDPHVWLDPVNAKAIAHEIEEALSEADPKNSEKYKANAERLMGKLDELIKEVSAEINPIREKGFIVFHDAYQYFEQRFGVSAVGSITVSPEILPGAKRIMEMQEKVRDLKATCVFSEPQFEPKLVATIIENTSAKTGTLDPLGASIDSGHEAYFTLIRNMGRSLKTCLSDVS